MKKDLILIACVLLFISVLSNKVFADVMTPDYFTKKCNTGEAEIECNFKSKEPFGPLTYNGCKQYENNPNYRLLTSHGSSFGGNKKFCFKPASFKDSLGFYTKQLTLLFPSLFVTLILEFPILYLFGLRSKKSLLTILLLNSISVFLLNLVLIFFPPSSFFIIIILELLVVIFEAISYKFLLKYPSLKKMLIYSFITNSISAVFGTLILIYTQGLLF